MKPPRRITVFTHHYPEDTRAAVLRLVEKVRDRGVEVRFPPAEVEKHTIDDQDGCVLNANEDDATDLAIVFGGDGTILTALRACAASGAPVFGFNYGAIGFLSTVERDQLDEGIDRALSGDFDVLRMPALETEVGGRRRMGVNDISFQRRANSRVATLEYAVGAEQLGRVRSDGLVAATPVGSTGYNLALVVAPGDALNVANASERDAVDITTDGRPVGELVPGESVELRFRDDQVSLAQLDGATFYHRFREKFGRLAY